MIKSITRITTIMAALALITVFTGCDRRTPEERLETAVQFYQTQDINSAEMEALKVIEKAPDDPVAIQAAYLLAQIYMATDRAEEAEQQLEGALGKISQKEPMGKELLKSYIAVLTQGKKYDQALETVSKYQKEFASDEGQTVNLQMLEMQVKTDAGRTTEARALLQSRIDVTTDPAEMDIYRQFYFTTYEKDNDSTGAIQYMESELAKAKDADTISSLRLTMAGLYATTGDYDKSRSYITMVNDAFDANARNELDRRVRINMAMQLANAYQSFGNVPGSRRIYQELYDSGETDPRFLNVIVPALAVDMMRLGETSASESFLIDAVKTHPGAKLDPILKNFQDIVAAGKAVPDTSTLVMKYKADPTVLWPTTLPELLSTATLAAPATSGTVEAVAVPVDAATTASTDQGTSAPTVQ